MKKEFRVKRNEDFSKIIARKKSFANSCFIIYKDENQMGHGRVGISVSKKLGNAVTRNKIKRQLRMMIQECFHFDEEVDYIVIVRKRFLDNTYIENKKEVRKNLANNFKSPQTLKGERGSYEKHWNHKGLHSYKG